MDKLITFVKIINNDKILEKSFEGILLSNAYKKGLVDLIVIDIVKNDTTKKFLEEKNLESYKIEKNNLEIYEIYNEIKENVKTDFVNFSTTNSFVKTKTIDKIIELLKTNKCVILNPEFYALDNLKYVLHYIKNKEEYKKINYLSISENINFYNPLLDSFFFNLNLVKEIKFQNLKLDMSIIRYILDIMNELKHFVYLLDECLYIEPLENDFENSITQYQKDWYIDFMRDLALPILKEENSKWIQSTILYLISIRYASNLNARNKNILTNDEIELFEDLVKESLKYIEYDVFEQFSSPYIMETITEYLLKMKIKREMKLDIIDDKLYLCDNDEKIMNVENLSANIMCIEFDNDKLNFDVEILKSFFIQKGSKISVYLNEKEISIRENKVYSKTKLFGNSKHEKYTFNFSIDAKSLSSNDEIIIKYSYKDYNLILPMNFKKPLSKLNLNWKNSYFKFEKNILTYDVKNSKIIIKKKSNFTIIKKEIGLIFEFLFKSKNKILGIKSVLLRILYWLTKPFYRKRIWISFDKLFKGGDNGEYLYHYVTNNVKNKNIKMCYVINGNSGDFERLKHEKNILKFRSVKHYLNVLNCEFMFATHANPYDYNGYTSGVEKYFRDLLTFKTFCIQHGLSVNDIAKFQNRVYANTKLYFCASKYEIKNLNLPEYDYEEFNALRLTGVPRYDGLKNKEEKIILITPTWRQSSSSKLVHINMTRQYNSNFKNSEYYKVYNGLINDKKLIDCAKKNGYKIIYLLHPAVSSQIKDFKGNKYVKVMAATSDMSYEDILTKSSLMVTDYSGVQFDFAYMRKPILYYHPKSLPPHYEESCFIYDTMGFGPIIENQNELIDSLCDYMRNNCKMKKEYISRADDFFEYSDFDSCKRIVDEVFKYNGEK